MNICKCCNNLKIVASKTLEKLHIVRDQKAAALRNTGLSDKAISNHLYCSKNGIDFKIELLLRKGKVFRKCPICSGTGRKKKESKYKQMNLFPAQTTLTHMINNKN